MTRQVTNGGHDYQEPIDEKSQPTSAERMGPCQGTAADHRGAKHARVNAALRYQRLRVQLPGMRSTWSKKGR